MHAPRAVRPATLPTLGALLALAACGGGDGGDGPTPPSGAAAVDTLFTFPTQWSSPQVRIRPGGSIVFVFEGGVAHNAIFRLNPANPPLAGAPADIPITTDAVVRRTFPTAGSYPVNCTVHPGMISEVVVGAS